MVDLNCDMGEGRTDDHLFMPYIQRCNIACGAHAGDPEITRQTLRNALKHGLIIGAHPSYPDKENFGRKSIQSTEPDLQQSITSRIGNDRMPSFRPPYYHPAGWTDHWRLCTRCDARAN